MSTLAVVTMLVRFGHTRRAGLGVAIQARDEVKVIVMVLVMTRFRVRVTVRGVPST